MTFVDISFSTLQEFFALMKKRKLNFVIFRDNEGTGLANAFALEADEAGYYVNIQQLNEECFNRLMRNSATEQRLFPGIGETQPVPHIRSFIGGEGFVDTYFENEKRDIREFLERSRAAKK